MSRDSWPPWCRSLAEIADEMDDQIAVLEHPALKGAREAVHDWIGGIVWVSPAMLSLLEDTTDAEDLHRRLQQIPCRRMDSKDWALVPVG